MVGSLGAVGPRAEAEVWHPVGRLVKERALRRRVLPRLTAGARGVYTPKPRCTSSIASPYDSCSARR